MTATPQAATFCRHAILDEGNALYGYELVDPAAGPDTARWIASLPDLSQIAGRRPVLLHCAPECLDQVADVLPDAGEIVIQLASPPPGCEADEMVSAALATLRGRGFAFALPHEEQDTPWSWIVQPHLYCVDMRKLGRDAGAQAIRAARAHGAIVMATGVSSAGMREAAGVAGANLFRGRWFEQPMLAKAPVMRANQAVILKLVALLRRDGDVAEVEELLKHDPALSFNLLRYVNSAGLAVGRRVESFRAAVLLVGVNRLLRWATVMLATSHPDLPALGHTAVVRGRLMELLSQLARPRSEHDDAFVAGVFSLLDAMTSIPMDSALQGLGLGDDVEAAILRHAGPMAPLLALAEACESADDDAFAHHAIGLGLSGHQVNMAHLDSLAWADSILQAGDH